jgi:hypothetical protein
VADYLSRLVDRTLGLFPTVQPDVPPAFATETAEIAPYDAPHGRPPPGRVTHHTGPSPQRPTLHPEPPERPGMDTPAITREEDEEPDTGERGYDVPPSTAAGPPDRTGSPPARGAGSSVTESTGEREEIGHHPAGPGQEDDEPLPDPEKYRRRPAITLPDTTVPDETREPEGSRVLPDPREAPPPESPAELVENPTGPSEPPIDLDESPTGSSRSGARPAERPGTERGETEVAVSPRRRGTPGVKEHAAPPADATVPDRRARPGRPRPTAPDHPTSQAAGDEGRDLTIGREERERTPEPAADARGLPLAEPASSGRAEPSSGPPRRPVPDTPLVPVSGRPRATPAAEFVGAPHKREGTQEASSPTVRITIGRVEVRAVTPEPAQPLPAARPEPALSLEDYLRQRDGGRR